MDINALYLRKSRGDPENETVEETLDKHKRTLLEFAKKANIAIGEIYIEVVSGDGLFVRPEMMRLMQDVGAGKYRGVLCMDIDRLGRVDTKDRGIILDCFKSTNTLIITPQKTYDLSDEIDEFSTEMQMLFARQELKKITKRLQAGLVRAAADGCHVGEPPFGYRRAYVDKKPTLEVFEPEAEIVRMIFDMYVNQHFGSSTIAKKLNEMGIKTKKNTPFSRTSVQFILSNQVYTGKIIYNKRHHIKKKMPTDKHKSVLNPEDKWIVADGMHKHIVDDITFHKAQEIRKQKSHPPSYTGEVVNPLAGIVRCANCGKIMTRQTSKKTPPRLICNTVGCNRSTLVSKVEDRVLDYLRGVLKNTTMLLDITPENTERIKAVEFSNKELKKQLTLLDKQSSNLYDLLEQGVYDVKTFTDRSKAVSERIKNVKTALDENNKQLNSLNVVPRRKKLLPLIAHLIENYDKMTPAEQNLAYKQIISNVYYKRDKSDYTSDFEISIEFRDWI